MDQFDGDFIFHLWLQTRNASLFSFLGKQKGSINFNKPEHLHPERIKEQWHSNRQPKFSKCKWFLLVLTENDS